MEWNGVVQLEEWSGVEWGVESSRVMPSRVQGVGEWSGGEGGEGEGGGEGEEGRWVWGGEGGGGQGRGRRREGRAREEKRGVGMRPHLVSLLAAPPLWRDD